MTAICRLNVDDILSEWTAHKCDQPTQRLLVLTPPISPYPSLPACLPLLLPFPLKPRFLTNWCDPRVTRHIRRHFSWLAEHRPSSVPGAARAGTRAGGRRQEAEDRPQLIERQQRNCKRVESLSQKTKTYAAFIRQPTMKTPSATPTSTAPCPCPCSGHIVNAHSTLCHFVLMGCLAHSFYIKRSQLWRGHSLWHRVLVFSIFVAFCSCCCCCCCGKQITKQKSAQCS